MFKEASLFAQSWLGGLLLKKKTKIEVGGRTYRIPQLYKYTNWRISNYLVQQKITDSNLESNIAIMRDNEKIHCKVIACGLLAGYWKIKLFEWIYWRILFIRLTEEHSSKLLSAIVEKMDVGFFFQTTKIAEKLNSLLRKMTKIEAQSLFPAEPKSA